MICYFALSISFDSELTLFSRASKFLSAIDKRVLSAKSVEEKSEAYGKLLLYKMNNKGPSKEPCGTPQLIFCFVECLLPILVYCCLFVR